jgi:hypothetical protein
MSPPHVTRPAAALTACGPRRSDRAGQPISPSDRPQERLSQLCDKYGHLHSEAIFHNWSPAAIKALGIRRIDVKPETGTP